MKTAAQSHSEMVAATAVKLLLSKEDEILGTPEGTEEGRWEWRAGVLRWRKDGLPFRPFVGEKLMPSLIGAEVESESDIPRVMPEATAVEVEAITEIWRATERAGEPWYIGAIFQALDCGCQEDEAVLWLANAAVEGASEVEEDIRDIEYAGEEVNREFDEGREAAYKAQIAEVDLQNQ